MTSILIISTFPPLSLLLRAQQGVEEDAEGDTCMPVLRRVAMEAAIGGADLEGRGEVGGGGG